LEPDRRVTSHRVYEVVVAHRFVVESDAPERHHRALVECVDRELHGLHGRRIASQAEVLSHRRDRARHCHVFQGEGRGTGRADAYVNAAGTQVHVRQAIRAAGKLGDTANQRRA